MALRDDLRRDVSSLLASRCGVDEALITQDSELYTQLGLDSLDLIGVAQVLQERYGVSLDNEGVAEIRTVCDILTFVEGELAAAFPDRAGAFPDPAGAAVAGGGRAE